MSSAYRPENNALIDEFIKCFPELKEAVGTSKDFIIDQVRGLTTELANKHSHCPSTWTSRSYNLLRMGYPELAVGDAFKAKYLIDQYYNPEDVPIKSKVAKQIRRQTKVSVMTGSYEAATNYGRAQRVRRYADHASDRAVLVLAQALFAAMSYVECYETLKAYVPKLCPSSTGFSKLKALAERAQIIEDTSRMNDEDYVTANDQGSVEARRSGSIIPVIYPWMANFVQRSGRVLSEAQQRVQTVSNGKCLLGSSMIEASSAPLGSVETQSNSLGIFSHTQLAKDESVMIDRTSLSGVVHHDDRCSCCRGAFTSQRVPKFEAQCCDAIFCSDKCREMSMSQFHFPSCKEIPGQRVSKYGCPDTEQLSSDTTAMHDLLFRVLSHLENNPAIHPLRASAISAMTPICSSSGPILFSLWNDIERPFEMLLQLHIDPFGDHGFDTWVIQTIQSRLRNNTRKYYDVNGRYHAAVNLSYMFFNHSCDPNIEIDSPTSGCSDVLAIASRSIDAGEELFISYLEQEDLLLPYEERKELLKHWTGGDCQCNRCQGERAVAEFTHELVQCAYGDVVDRIDEGYKSEDHLETNRYASPKTLIESHPAMENLKRRTFYGQLFDTFDYNEDVTTGDSPTPKRPKRCL